MWYRRENGVIVGGPYNCPQTFPVEVLSEQDPEVLAMLAKAIPTPRATLEDVIAILTPQQKALLQANLDAKGQP